MIARIETFFRRIRRGISRSEWLVKACGLSTAEGVEHDPGLVMIQIDGLSRRELQKALAADELPFLKRLLEREDYHAYLHYSGLPSTTPAVQAEVFYGKRGAVPGFGFRDHRSGERVRMYQPEAVARIEEELARECDVPLASGGSSYSDIYTGGAAEPHFCPGDVGMRSLLAGVKARILAVLFAANLCAFLRVGVLLIVECAVALADSIRGIIGGRNPLAELKFVLARVGVCILLRELIVIGVKLDLVRGQPIIHLNLLGYDEQSHRRGPDSKFAHWTLRGIDDAIVRIWRAANRATRRDYDLWIYSDHGQERTQPYAQLHGRSLHEAVAEILRPAVLLGEASDSGNDESTRRSRHQPPVGRMPSPDGTDEKGVGEPAYLLEAPGPVGWLYPPGKLDSGEVREIAERLVTDARVPAVLAFSEPDRLMAWTDDGVFELPGETGRIFGADHPFFDDFRRDLVTWLRNSDAGTFLLLGWRKGLEQPRTFAIENGAHGGVGPNETAGFALLPVDAPLPAGPWRPEYLRPSDLRDAALRFLNGSFQPEEEASKKKKRRSPGEPFAKETERLRVMTNRCSCL